MLTAARRRLVCRAVRAGLSHRAAAKFDSLGHRTLTHRRGRAKLRHVFLGIFRQFARAPQRTPSSAMRAFAIPRKPLCSSPPSSSRTVLTDETQPFETHESRLGVFAQSPRRLVDMGHHPHAHKPESQRHLRGMEYLAKLHER